MIDEAKELFSSHKNKQSVEILLELRQKCIDNEEYEKAAQLQTLIEKKSNEKKTRV